MLLNLAKANKRFLFLGGSFLLPGFLTILTFPIIKNRLGDTQFGVYMMIYTIFIVTSILDLGGSKALTLYAASGYLNQKGRLVNFFILLISFFVFVILFSFFKNGLLHVDIFDSKFHLEISILSALFAGCNLYKIYYDACKLYIYGFIMRVLVISLILLAPILFFSELEGFNKVFSFLIFFLLLTYLFNLFYLEINLNGLEKKIKLTLSQLNRIFLLMLFSFLGAVVIFIGNYYDRFFLVNNISSVDFGEYTSVVELALKSLVVSSYFSSLLIFDISDLKENGFTSSRIYFKRYLKKSFFLSAVLLIAIYLFFIYYFFEALSITKFWSNSFLLPLFLGILLDSCAALCSSYLEAHKRQILRFFILLLVCVIYFFILRFFIAKLGTLGIAFSWLAKGILEVALFFYSIRIFKI